MQDCRCLYICPSMRNDDADVRPGTGLVWLQKVYRNISRVSIAYPYSSLAGSHVGCLRVYPLTDLRCGWLARPWARARTRNSSLSECSWSGDLVTRDSKSFVISGARRIFLGAIRSFKLAVARCCNNRRRIWCRIWKLTIEMVDREAECKIWRVWLIGIVLHSSRSEGDDFEAVFSCSEILTRFSGDGWLVRWNSGSRACLLAPPFRIC